MRKESYFYLICIGFLLFLIGILYQNDGKFIPSTASHDAVDLSGGEYLRFVFIGSSGCYFSNNEEIQEIIVSLKEDIQSKTIDLSKNFISTGISVDTYSETGIDFLKKSGPYTEILSGLSSHNLGSIKYSSGNVSTPTVMLFYENYETELVGYNYANLLDSQVKLATVTGMDHIQYYYEFVKNSTKPYTYQIKVTFFPHKL